MVRNKLRRRCRSALVDLARTRAGGIPPGAYLVSAAPGAAEASYDELRSHLGEALDRLSRTKPTRSAPGDSAPPTPRAAR